VRGLGLLHVGPVAADHTRSLQPLHAREHGRARQPDRPPEVGHRGAAVHGEQAQQTAIEIIEVTIRRRHGPHGGTPSPVPDAP